MLSARWIAKACGGELVRPRPAPIRGFALDSRRLEPEQVFVALRGRHQDGHDFVPEALQKGASAALIDEPALVKSKALFNLILVEDVPEALRRTARAYRALFQVPLIAITGSVGKTTTKELLGRMLARKFRAYHAPGNFNNELGLPLAVLNMPLGTEIAVFELATQRPGDLALLAGLLDPSVAVITCIGDAHLAFFRDRQQLAEEKWSLVEALPAASGIAVLNADDPLLWRRATGQRFRVDFARRRQEALYRAVAVEDRGLDGLAFELVHPGGRVRLESRLLGEHNVYNVLAAAAVALEMRVPTEEVQRAAAAFAPVSHRLALRPTRWGLALDDCYNASPTAVRAALAVLGRYRGPQPKVFVFGEMRELGPQAARFHRQVARWVQRANVERVFTLGELAGETTRALRRAGWPAERAQHAASLEELVAQLERSLNGTQALLLVKGSRALGLETLLEPPAG